MAGQSNSRNRPSAQDPETGTTGHRTKRIAHAGTDMVRVSNRSPSAWHRRRKQAPKRKTRHGLRFRSGSVPLPVQVPHLCMIYKMQSHQASSFLHQNPQPTARFCCPPALDRSPPHLCTKNHGQSNAAMTTSAVSGRNSRLGHSAHLYFFLSHRPCTHSFLQTGV